jgi:hypothetical protein
MCPEKLSKKRSSFVECLKFAGSSEVPVLKQILGAWNKIEQDRRERYIANVLAMLEQKVDDLNQLFGDEWLKTPEGEKFAAKVFDSTIDAQLADKRELFVNTLINGIWDKDTGELEKLKFIDVLRHLSRASLDVLADIHNMFKDQVRGPSRRVDPISAYPQVDPGSIAEKLSSKYDPYLVTSACYEMQSQGLFSNVGEWQKQADGSYKVGGGFDTAWVYTDFACRFVEFIIVESQEKPEDT